MKEIDKFYHSLMQDVQARTLASEDGGTQEQMFTSMAVDSLAESGETENGPKGDCPWQADAAA